MREWSLVRWAAPVIAGIASGALAGCATFEGPPEVSIVGLTEGKLTDPKAPIGILFDKAPDLSTLKLSIAPYKVDPEGLLGDEDQSGATGLDAYFSHDPVMGDVGGKLEFAADGVTATITHDQKLPVGAALVLVIEPKLAAKETGAITTVRRRVIFSYSSGLECNKPVALFKSGAYFFLAAIKEPIPIQVALFARIEVDPATGAAKTQFTKARRNTTPGRCPMECATGDACRLLPAPECVKPSVPAGSVDEFSDYLPNPDPPTGFGFSVVGCVVDQDETTTAFATAKVDVEVQQPKVTLVDADLTASFSDDGAGVLRGTGSLSAPAVTIGPLDSGPGTGDLTVRWMSEDEAPPGIPGPEE